jgi:hypothetical protein
MPGTASQPIRERDDELMLASETDDDAQRKGILQRLRERRMEREKKGLPGLPPAVEPKKEEKKETPKEPSKLDMIPKSVPDSPLVPAPSVQPTPMPSVQPTVGGDLKVVRALVDQAAKKFAETPDFEAKLTKRETVSGKKQPTEEMRFLFRQEPFSVRLTVIGEQGRGREVLYVKGQNAGKLIIVTGEGDNRLLGAGKKLELDSDSPLATSRTRGKIEDSGLGRPIRVLSKFVQDATDGKRSADTIKSLGAVEWKEFTKPVDGVEVTLKPGDDSLLPKGGKRLYYFDADPKSPSYRLPVLIITYEPNDVEVEYYLFTDFKLPANLTDADFSPEKLGRKR